MRAERRAPGQAPDMTGVTQEEISKLTKAMKNKEFRDHIDEYTREVSDPAHRQEYLDYLAQIEAKGEMPEGQQLLRCQPGLCVKTHITFKNGQKQKCFINIVHSDQLDDLSFTDAEKGGGQQVHLPYSLAPPRPDRDSKDDYCMTCDFAVSTGTFTRAIQQQQILKMLIDTAADGLSQQFLKGHEEVSKDYKVMQRMPCKGGQPMPMSVRGELLKDKGAKNNAPKLQPGADAVTPSELKEMRKNAKQRKPMAGVPEPDKAEEDEEAAERAAKAKAQEPIPGRIRVPQHRLVHVGNLDLTDFMEVSGRQNPNTVTSIPKQLKLVTELPTVKKSSDINMEVTRNNIVVEVEGKFYLDLPLPYEVEESNGSAKFDKSKQTLTLELPVVPKMPDPELVAAAKRLQGLGSFDDSRDGALSEGRGSEDELPPLDDDKEQVNTDEAVDAHETTPAAEPAKTEEKRELLELDPHSSSLRMAAQPAQEEAPPPSSAQNGVEKLVEEDEEEEDLEGRGDQPDFIAADSFQGARAGYYFGTGEEGLGYYRDMRQKRVKRRAAKPKPPPNLESGPLVMEVETRVEALTLSASAQSYIEMTSSLSKRLAAADAEVVSEELVPLDWHLSRQNLTLRIGIPGRDDEVADLRMSLVGRRLTLSLCSRPMAACSAGAASSAPSRWRRHCLRRTLGGAVDLRQWHAELLPASGAVLSHPSAPRKEVQVTLRKAKKEAWETAFVGASSQAASAGDSSMASEVSAEAAGAEAVALGLIAEPEPSEDQGPAPGVDMNEEAVIVEDSAELDIASPVVQDTAAQAEGPASLSRALANPDASAAAVQSATVMGQSVLLQNRLMYQLL